MKKKEVKLNKLYYLLLDDGQEVLDYAIPYGKKSYTWKTVYDGDVVKVLGPVPSFAEVELMRKNIRELNNQNDKLRSLSLKGIER